MCQKKDLLKVEEKFMKKQNKKAMTCQSYKNKIKYTLNEFYEDFLFNRKWKIQTLSKFKKIIKK